MLAGRERIEPHKDVAVRFREYGGQDVRHRSAGLHPLRQVPVHQAFIGQAFFRQALPEAFVQRIKQVPKPKEAALDGTLFSVPEMEEKMLDGFALVIAQVVEAVLQGFEIAHVLQQGPRVHPVFVHIVEIGQQHISPEDEFVQGLRGGIQFLVAGVQFQQQAQAVRNFQAREGAEKVTDGVQGRNQQGSTAFYGFSQVFAEEDHRPPVGEDEAGTLDVPGRVIMRGYLLQERRHWAFS